jgi:hypothetical protein
MTALAQFAFVKSEEFLALMAGGKLVHLRSRVRERALHARPVSCSRITLRRVNTE